MKRHTRHVFLALIIAQAAHSIEECAFGLWKALPSQLALDTFIDARALAFTLVNIALVAFGIWCYAIRVRPGHAAATRWVWLWGVAEFVNGLAHITMALRRGGYFPGVATATVLLVLAAILVAQLSEGRAGRRDIMKRTHVNFIIDTIGLVALILLTTTGWIMRFILPPGSGSGRIIWGLDRHGWGYIHTWLAVVFACAMIVHLILHWNWVMCMIRGEQGERRPVRGIVAVIVLLIALVVGIVSLVTPVQEVSGRPEHEEHSEQSDQGGQGQGQGQGRGGGLGGRGGGSSQTE